MRNQLSTTLIGILALIFPIGAIADLNSTVTLTANSAVSLDSGATSTSGGDLLWSGSTLTPQGKAGAFNFGNFGASSLSLLTQATLKTFPYSQTALTASVLTAGDLFAVRTNGGNYAAVLVTAQSGTSITLQFTTYGVSTAASGPAITQVLNNFSYIPAGFSNSGIAPGSLFVIVGSGLASPTAQVALQSSSGSGLPTTLNGAGVQVTVNGTTVVPAFYYAIAGALALVMPSSTPAGTGQVTVTYNNQTSSPYTIQVTPSAMGFDTYYGSGSGLGVATNPATGALYNYSNSIPPGTTVTLWGSGLGADPARDTKYVPAAFPINNLSHVYVGGMDAPILYQGASGFPGVNQVNITIPASTPTGCNVMMVGVTAGGVPTNFVTLPIGGGVCSDPLLGTGGSQTTTVSGQSTVKVGALAISQYTVPGGGLGGADYVSPIATGSFQSYTGPVFGSASGTVSPGGCVVVESLTASPKLTNLGLDAGNITVTGPGGVTQQVPAGATGTYLTTLPAGFLTASGGTFTFHGSGGADVGAFTAAVTVPTPILNWTNQSAAVNVTRAAGLPITWTGGGSSSYVEIIGSSSSVDGALGGFFTCIASSGAGQFTVPNYVLGALPAGSGSVVVSNQTQSAFTAVGLDQFVAAAAITVQINSTFK